jgi:hypothetical protein
MGVRITTVSLELLVSPAIGVAKDAISLLWRSFRKPDPVQLIERRQKIKAEVESHLHWLNESARYGEAIIRDIKRADEYPNADTKSKGVSAWYKTTLLGTYHRGIQIGLGFNSLKRTPDGKSWYMTRDRSHRDINAICVGRIPYDRIVVIDWNGDEFYGDAHIYCRYLGWRPAPCEELVFCEEHIEDYPGPHSWYDELVSHAEALKATKRHEPNYFA